MCKICQPDQAALSTQTLLDRTFTSGKFPAYRRINLHQDSIGCKRITFYRSTVKW